MSARILIVAGGHLSRNPRPWKEAAALAGAGHDVTVLCVRDHAPSDALDRELLAGARFRLESIDLLGGQNHRGGSLVRRARRWLARKSVERGGWQSAEALGPARDLLRRARDFSADLTIVHTEAALWVGMRLLDEGRRVAADIEDWHSEDLPPEDRAGRPLGLLRMVERTLLRRAAYLTTTSEALAAALVARHGGNRPEVITNSFPLQPEPRQGPPGAPPALLWFSQTLGPGRGLEKFIGGWVRTAAPSRLVLIGGARGGYDDRLRRMLPPEKRGGIEIRPPVPPAELPGVIARHDVGLALEDRSIASRNLTITNKMLQYLNAGLAVVASDTAGQREVLARGPGAGVTISLDDPAGSAAALDRLLRDAPALAACQKAARRLAEDTYCWEKEEPRLLGLVERAMAGFRT